MIEPRTEDRLALARAGKGQSAPSLYLINEKSAIDLTLTENPFGCSRNVGFNGLLEISSYSGGNYFKLLENLEKHFSAESGSVILGAGIDGLLSEIIFGYFGDKDIICTPLHTFPKAAYYASGRGVQVLYSNMSDDLNIDLDSMMACVQSNNAKACYICNPNNPTGLFIPSSDIVEFARRCPCLLIVDEANGEFMDDSAILGIHDVKNLLVLRTFSKIYGLAGARVGYAIANSNLLSRLFRSRPRYAIGEPSALAAAIALADQEHVNLSRALVVDESKFLQRALAARGFATFGALTNCFVASLPHETASCVKFFGGLRAAGVSLVHGEAFNLPSNFFRVAPQTRQVNEAFLHALDRVMLELSE